MIQKYDFFLFDADDTLFNFCIAEEKALVGLFKTLGIYNAESEAQYITTYKQVNTKLWTQLEHHTISADEIKKTRFPIFLNEINQGDCIEEEVDLNAMFLEYLTMHTELIPTAHELLKSLDYKQKSIITNGLSKVQRDRLLKTQIHHMFDHIVISEEIHVAKPSSSFFNYVHELYHNAEKDRFLVIGDSLHSDIHGGNNYGFDTCWVNLSKKENNTEFRPTYEVNNLLDILNL